MNDKKRNHKKSLVANLVIFCIIVIPALIWFFSILILKLSYVIGLILFFVSFFVIIFIAWKYCLSKYKKI